MYGARSAAEVSAWSAVNADGPHGLAAFVDFFGCAEEAVAGAASGVVDDVGAVFVLLEGNGLGLVRIAEAAEVAGGRDVLDVDLDVRVDGLGASFVAGVEVLDQRDVNATDEADGAGLATSAQRLHRRGTSPRWP